MKEFKPFKEGKVREVYDNGDSLIIVATDRISAFDNILKNRITDKGAILTQMSKFWFDFYKGCCSESYDFCRCQGYAIFSNRKRFDGNSMMCKKLEMLPIESVSFVAISATQIKDCTIVLYKKCAEYALSKGIIIADTKFEFGLDENGKVVLGDDAYTGQLQILATGRVQAGTGTAFFRQAACQRLAQGKIRTMISFFRKEVVTKRPLISTKSI